MPDATVAADARAMSDETALGHARLVAAAQMNPGRQIRRPEAATCAATIALTVGGAAEELIRARQMVERLQARRAEIARTCAAMREMLERK